VSYEYCQRRHSIFFPRINSHEPPEPRRYLEVMPSAAALIAAAADPSISGARPSDALGLSSQDGGDNHDLPSVLRPLPGSGVVDSEAGDGGCDAPIGASRVQAVEAVVGLLPGQVKHDGCHLKPRGGRQRLPRLALSREYFQRKHSMRATLKSISAFARARPPRLVIRPLLCALASASLPPLLPARPTSRSALRLSITPLATASAAA